MNLPGNLAATLGSGAADDRLTDGAWSLHGTAPVRLLLVEDDEEDAIILKGTLAQIPDVRFDVEWVTSGVAALEALATGWYDASLIDYNLGGSTGVQFIRNAKAAGCVTPLIMLTGQRDRTTDMVAMKAGASDFLVKGQTDATQLDRTLRYAITSARINEELRRGREQILGLEQIGRLLAGDWPIDDAIEQLLRVMGDAFEYQYVAVYLRSARGFDLRRSRGYHHPIATVDASDRMLDRIVVKRQPTLVSNFTRSPDHRDVDANVRREMCLPIVVDGRTIGLLSVGSPDGEELGERDLTILGAVTDRLAAALAMTLERELMAAQGRQSTRLSAVIRDLGAIVDVGDDPPFWTTLVESVSGALVSEVVLLGSVPSSPGEPGSWQELARSATDRSAASEEFLGTLADTAMTTRHAFDGSRNLSAVRLDGWHHPVVLIIINGLRDAPGEVLDGLATAAEPVLRLRVALGATADVGQARLSMFCLAVDWAIERRQRAGRSGAYAALVIDSLDETVDSAQLASELRASSHHLVAALSEDRVGVVLEIERRDRTGATAVALIATVARTRQVLGGISIIGPDRAAAAFGAASGALELARRLGPGNAVVA